jgi:hypothetical protein
MRRRLSALCCAVPVLLLTSCAVGTGAPDWDPPLTWHQDGVSVTLDDEKRVTVTGIPHEESACESAGGGSGEVDGSGEWSWNGFGRLILVVDGAEIAVQSAFDLGEPDWTGLLVDRCGTDFDDDAPRRAVPPGAVRGGRRMTGCGSRGIFQPTGGASMRASVANSNGGPVTPFTGKPVQPPGPARRVGSPGRPGRAWTGSCE